MKLTKEQLNGIVHEELQSMIESGEIEEGWIDRMGARMKGGMTRAGGAMKGLAQRGVGAAASALGQKDIGDQLAATGKETGDAAKSAGQQRKIQAILSTHIKELNTDLTKLGVADDPKVVAALEALENAIRRSSLQSGQEYKRTAAEE